MSVVTKSDRVAIERMVCGRRGVILRADGGDEIGRFANVGKARAHAAGLVGEVRVLVITSIDGIALSRWYPGTDEFGDTVRPMRVAGAAG